MAERETKKTSADSSSAKKEKQIDEKSLDEHKKELDSLIGLDAVKNEIDDLTNLIRVQRLRKERGYANVETSQHLVFTGNPGTGKTTVARLVGKIYHALGYLSKGHFVEVDRSGLVAGYVGQTAIKTQEVIKSALGGVLFIDEAYALAVDNSENDYGKEAIETILKAMEDNRDDFVVIVAGYDNLMHKFINSNPGLKSRFNKYIHFPDYNGNELYGIFKSHLDKNEYTIAKNADVAIKSILNQVYDSRDDNFGNGRTVRNYFEQLIEAHASRIVKIESPTETDLTLITIDDIREVFEDSGYQCGQYNANPECDDETVVYESWFNSGLHPYLDTIKDTVDFEYKKIEFMPNCGEFSYCKIKDGKDIDIDSLANKDFPLAVKDTSSWYSEGLGLAYGVDSITEEQAEKVHEIVKKYLPEDQIVDCEDYWEDDNSIILGCVQWETDSFVKVSEFLEELNAVVEIPEDKIRQYPLTATTFNAWFDMKNFGIIFMEEVDGNFVLLGTDF